MKLSITGFIFGWLCLISSISHAQSDPYLDVVTYNIEWLGKPDKAGLNITRDEQITYAAQDILDAGADIYALQEIVVDDVNGDALTDLVAKLNAMDNTDSWSGGYNPYFSYWWNPDFENYPAQRQAYIYRNSTVTDVTFTTLLTDVVLEGDERFASGRLPYMLQGNVTIEGVSQQISLVNLHLKCCRGNSDRRKYSMETLVAELDNTYRDINIFVLGDLNVADRGGADGEIATWGLYDDLDIDGVPDYEHAAGAKKDLSYNDIDHILISNELGDELWAAPADLHNQTLASSISDHDLIKTALMFGETSTDTEAPTTPTDLTASNVTDSDFTLSWTASTDNVGVSSYDVSQDGNIIGSTTTTSLYVSGLSSSTTYTYTVVAKDDAGNVSPSSTPLDVTTTSSSTVEEPMLSSISLVTYSSGPWVTASGDVTVTSNGAPVDNALVEITWSGDYSGTGSGYTDSNGVINFETQRVRNGASYTLTINNITKDGFFWDMTNSETSEGTGSNARMISLEMDYKNNISIYPNPFTNFATVDITKSESGYLNLIIYDMSGRIIENLQDKFFEKGSHKVMIGENISEPGIYFIKVKDSEKVKTIRLIRQ